MHLALDFETSESAGADGMYQIDEEGGNSLGRYLKSVFGSNTTYEVAD